MCELSTYPISVNEVMRARHVVGRYVKPSQLIRYEGLSKALQADVYVKHENHNPTGTFKIRGGVNLITHLKRNGIENVVTFSTGNHGVSIAQAALWHGLHAVIVVPENNNPVKNQNIRNTGAELVEKGRNSEDAERAAEELSKERQLHLVHAANEPHLINGVGTEFLEIIEELPDIDIMIAPLGAGSEISAAITTLRAFRPKVEIIAVQAEQSPAAYNSWKQKKMCTAPNETFAGGISTGIVYEIPFRIYSKGLNNFVLLSEEEIYDAVGMALYYTHNLAESAGAAAIGAAFKIKDYLKGKKVVLQMSGCNASPDEIKKAVTRRSFREGFISN